MDRICPYLGMIDDPRTSTVYPTGRHACHRADPPKAIVIHHQRDFCLTEQHRECPGYISGWPKGFPRSLHNKRFRRGRSVLRSSEGKLSAVGIIGIGLLAVLLVLGVYLAITHLGLTSISTPQRDISAEGVGATETHLALAALLTPSETPTMTETSTPNPAPTNTPTPDYTPTQTPGPALSTPFGGQDFRLLIHEVQTQENITSIAIRYNTTVDALWILNGLSDRTIQVGDPMVVCVDCTETQGLPQLQAVYLEAGRTLSDLANAYNAPIRDLREWNGLGEADWIAGDRWVVVPFD